MANREETGRGHRRPALLDEARKLFFAHGYNGTTMLQVAKRAGLSKRAVYLYFTNKDELFIAVAEQGLLILRKKLETISITDLDIEPAIEAVMECYLWFAHKHANYYRIIFQEATSAMIANIGDGLRERVAEHERACLSVVVGVVEKAIAQGLTPPIDPWEAAVIFWGIATGIIQLSLGGSQTIYSRKNREELIAKAIWLLYEGLKHPPQRIMSDNKQSAAKTKK